MFFQQIPKPEYYDDGDGLLAVVYFAKDTFLLTGPHLATAERVRKRLQTLSRPSVEVNGYASGEGSSSYNLVLSEKRRRALILLVSNAGQGMLSASGKGYGEIGAHLTETATDPRTLEQQRASNRKATILALPARMPRQTQPKAADLLPKLPDAPMTPNERLQLMLKTPVPSVPKAPSLAKLVKERLQDEVYGLCRKTNLSRTICKKAADVAISGVGKGAISAVDSLLESQGTDQKTRDAIKKAIEAAYHSVPSR
ncbi:MAG: hypothetical protein V2I32_07675 [Desulforhopalus sp.]|jgi:hypothetical protein|nr:hypothetical protein [Desulforhopalus sp.]